MAVFVCLHRDCANLADCGFWPLWRACLSLGFPSAADITSVNLCNTCTEHDPASQRLESLQIIIGYISYVYAETLMPRVVD